MLAGRGLVADYFTFYDGSKSFADSFYNRSKKAFRDITIEKNYFLSLYLLGRFNKLNAVPAYLKAENYETIRSRVDRIKNIPGSLYNCIIQLIYHGHSFSPDMGKAVAWFSVRHYNDISLFADARGGS